MERALAERARRFRETRRLSSIPANLEEALQFRRDLPFFRQLEPLERARLPAVFTSRMPQLRGRLELAGTPRGLLADMLSEAYLTNLARLVDALEGPGARLTFALSRAEARGPVLSFTWNGTLLTLGPARTTARRAWRYEPLPGRGRRAVSGEDVLEGSLHIGRRVAIGPVLTSALRYIVVGAVPLSVDDADSDADALVAATTAVAQILPPAAVRSSTERYE
ncbi:MAG: hypothetical protein H6746_19245 [Deltaproteobacteria bacterium]|nr:hypothetical protein [Deltaproteobacteria bacterium]